MDLTFYALVVSACIILMLAMWACSSGGVNKWGPDLTLELPVDVIRDALYPPNCTVQSPTEKGQVAEEVIPSAPTEFLHEPLLMHAEPMGMSSPLPNIKQSVALRAAPPPPNMKKPVGLRAPPPPPNIKQPVGLNVPQRNFQQPMQLGSSPANFNQGPPFLNSPAVRVLPTQFTPNHKLRPPVYSFTPEKPV